MSDEPVNPMRRRTPEEFFTAEPARRAAHAIKAGDLRTLDVMLAADPALAKAEGPSGMTLMLWAASLQEVDAVALLLRAGEDPNRMIVMGKQKFQLLALAAGGDNDALFSLLLAAGADPNSVDNGVPALFNAIHARRWDRLHRLLDAGADIDAPGPLKSPPAIYLAKLSEYAAIEDLLARGANVRAKDGAGATLTDYVLQRELPRDTPQGQAQARLRKDLALRGLIPRDP